MKLDRDPAAPAPDWLRELREEMRSTLRRLVNGRKVIYIDLPTHMNVGDSMIWLGTLHNLRAIDAEVVYTADIDSFEVSEARKYGANSVILMHGGGNYGDVWPRFQEFREYISSEFRDTAIVQLPQTVFFKEESGYARARAAFGKHPDYTLLVREHSSMGRVQEHLPKIKSELVPDFALGIERLNPPPVADRIPLILARGDHEASPILKTNQARLLPADLTDWGATQQQRMAWNVARMPLVGSKRLGAFRPIMRPLLRPSLASILSNNMTTAYRLFNSRPYIITDRLHAHVLAGLMGIPHIVLDNNYGKVAAVFESHTHQFETAHFARSGDDLISLARRLHEEAI